MSGRKFAVITIISTYCFIMIGSLVLTIMKIMELTTFLATIGSLSGVVMYIMKAYFDDKDRNINGSTPR